MASTGQAPAPFRAIELPDGSDPISKGIVRRVRRTDGTVTVEVAVDGLGEGLADRVLQQIRGAALTLPDTDHVRLLPVREEETSIELPEVDHVLAVASTKGGVGKTTVAVALARTLAARGLDVGLFDADIYGPNVPHLMDDVEGPILTDADGRPVPLDSDGVQVLSPGVAGGDPPTARRGAIAYGAVENLLGQGAWTDRDVLVLDMPAGSDDVVGAALEHVPVDGAIFVTTPFAASVDDTSRTVELFEQNGVETLAAVVNMNGFECECCGTQNRLFEDPVDIDVPTVHELPFDHDLQRNSGADGGYDGLADLAATVDRFLEEVRESVPADALDLRGLPLTCQVRQVSDELAFADPGSSVRAVVENPTAVSQTLHRNAGDLVDGMDRSQTGDRGALLEVVRA